MADALLIRADASSQIGSGHVMRCLALAEQWLHGGEPVFWASVQLPERLRERVQKIGAQLLLIDAIPGAVEDAQKTIQLAETKSTSWCVVDGYQFGFDYQKTLKSAGLRLLWIDDYGHAGHYLSDLVLNPGPGASPALYPGATPQTRLLLGCKYALLRREFLEWMDWQRPFRKPARKILVTLGGSDPDNITLRVLQALQTKECSGLEADIVIGGANPHAAQLQSLASHDNQRLHLDPRNLPELMAKADIAISGGGGTSLEIAFMGLPSLLICLADNQMLNCRHLHDAGAAIFLGRASEVTPVSIAQAIQSIISNDALLAEMSRIGRSLVDGRGAFRVWLHLNEDSIHLRPVTEADCRLTWEFANLPDVRAVSFTSAPIPWEKHLEWFARRLRDPNCRLWLATDTRGTPFGQVRFDLERDYATISIALAKEARGRNLGTLLIWKASRALLNENAALAEIHAWIKPENIASAKAFGKCGFEKAAEKEFNGQPAMLYRLQRTKLP